jgi:predicted ester cyclase
VTDIVIGPQGVIEIADLVATHQGRWAGLEPTGKPVNFKVIILFPWNREAQRFDGEKVYFDMAQLTKQLI